MSNYTTETINAQFMNAAFLDKIEAGHEKAAGEAASAFVRQKLREEGFTRKILVPQLITSAELDRDLNDTPRVIVEKEPDSVAANFPLNARNDVRYFRGSRYEVTFGGIKSAEFVKSKFELMTYRTNIQNILQENSVKDIQRTEDENFYGNVVDIATANSNLSTISGGFNVQNLMAAVKKLQQKQLPVGGLLMTQSMYSDLLAQPSTQIGSDAASSLFRGESGLDNFFRYKIITTIKNDILPDNRVIVFTEPQYLGQMYMLQDATVYLEAKADMLRFHTYESVGVGIGNVNGVIVCDF